MNAAEARKPVLWLGAHKTGTTFLQKALYLSQDALKAHDWGYMDLDEFRIRYTRPLIYSGNNSPVQPPEPGLNLIFDENIPNLVQHALSCKGLYPDLIARSHKVCTHLGIEEPDIYFGVRDYVGYLPSLYCETLKSTPYRPFDEFYLLDRHRLNWNDVIDRIRLAFPKSRVSVYAYESLYGNEAKLLSKVTGVPEANFVIPAKISRPGFSQAAIDALGELSKKRLVTREDVFDVIRTYRKGKELPAFQPFSSDEQKELRDRYKRQLRRMRNREDIEFVELS